MKEIIENLIASDNLRQLNETETIQKYIINSNKQYINLSSNDYLGLSNTDLQSQFLKDVDFSTHFLMSNPSSRLMTGNSPHYRLLEERVAQLYHKESALVLSSGFMLNSGALPALTTTDDYIIADKLVHASIINGIRLSECNFTRFRHNDVAHLRSILSKTECKGTIYVVLESIYSMDGDRVPLQEIVELKKEFHFKIYLDEAHAFGVVGNGGLGVAQEEGLIDSVDYLIVTLGKAAASSGAFIATDHLSKEVLVNRMRTLIYSTAMPPITLMWNKFILDRIDQFNPQREQLKKISQQLSSAVEAITGVPTPVSHIIPIMVGENGECMRLSEQFKEQGFWVTAIRYPTVAKGSARLRISLTAALTEDDINQFINTLRNLLAK